MKQSFYAGASGLIAHQENMNNIGHNIANVNTTGYKTVETSFRDLIYNDMYVNTPNNPLTGNGVKAVDSGINFEQGALYSTDRLYDFAIIGDGLFAISREGQTLYTRDGSFGVGLNTADGQAYLITQDEDFVLDQNGNRITLDVSNGANKVDFDDLKRRIGIFRFDNPYALEPVAGNKFAQTERSGAAQPGTVGNTLRQSTLERSKTNLADVMKDMIMAQRAYQVSARVVQTSDEIEQVVNNLRRG